MYIAATMMYLCRTEGRQAGAAASAAAALCCLVGEVGLPSRRALNFFSLHFLSTEYSQHQCARCCAPGIMYYETAAPTTNNRQCMHHGGMIHTDRCIDRVARVLKYYRYLHYHVLVWCGLLLCLELAELRVGTTRRAVHRRSVLQLYISRKINPVWFQNRSPVLGANHSNSE